MTNRDSGVGLDTGDNFIATNQQKYSHDPQTMALLAILLPAIAHEILEDELIDFENEIGDLYSRFYKNY